MKNGGHCDRILKRLEEAGPRGVPSFHLLDITHRYSARVEDLQKKHGYDIDSDEEKFGDSWGVRYVLVGRRASAPPPGSPTSSASSQETVLSLDDARQPAPSMFDPWSDAA